MSEIREELEQLREKIQDTIDQIDDIAFRELRAAVSRKEMKRPEIERRLTRARNALLRVLPLLREDEEADPEEF